VLLFDSAPILSYNAKMLTTLTVQIIALRCCCCGAELRGSPGDSEESLLICARTEGWNVSPDLCPTHQRRLVYLAAALAREEQARALFSSPKVPEDALELLRKAQDEVNEAAADLNSEGGEALASLSALVKRMGEKP